jgi:transposase
MKGLDVFGRVLLYRDPVDMRKSINGLSLMILDDLGMKFEPGSLFVFLSRCGKKMKMLYWDDTGFALWYKRLETEKYCWPRDHEDRIADTDSEQLSRLLLGYDVFQKPHEFLKYEHIF